MSIPDKVLHDLADYKTVVAQVATMEDDKFNLVVVHHIQNGAEYGDETGLLFDLKRIKLDEITKSGLPRVEEIDIEGMEHYVVDDLISLEMLMRLWVPRIEEMFPAEALGLTSMFSREPVPGATLEKA